MFVCVKKIIKKKKEKKKILSNELYTHYRNAQELNVKNKQN